MNARDRDFVRSFVRLEFGSSGEPKAAAKAIDRRHTPRRARDINAWIRPEGSFAAQKCQVIDISQSGARLEVADAYKIPTRFSLLFAKDSMGRHARVKWRRGTQIGAEFLTDNELRSIYLARRIADNIVKLQDLLRR